MIDFNLIKQTAQLRAEELLREWYPEGKVRGSEFLIGSPDGEAGKSMSINLTKGFGADFATGKKFGDMLDVYCARFGVDVSQGAVELGEKLGIKVKVPKSVKPVQGVKRQEPPVPQPPETWQEAFAKENFQYPPEDADLSPQAFVIPKRGVPDHVYVYRDTQGKPISVVTRWDANEEEGHGKLFSPWTWHNDGWSRKGTPTPRCPYGLDQLKKPRNVLIVEGEKACEAARAMFPDNPVITWPNGAAAVRSTDWSALKGRRVIVWPDNDAPGRAALAELAKILVPIIDKNELRFVDTSTMSPGFDAADMAGTTTDEAVKFLKERTKLWEQPKIEEPLVDEPAPGVVEEQDKHQLWTELALELKSNGTPYPSVDNAVRILTKRIPDGNLHYDEFLNQIRFMHNGTFVKLQDHHLITLTIAMQREYLIQDMKKQTVADAVAFYARSKIRNCLREWIESLVWDGVSRLDTFFSYGFGSDDNEYTRAVSRNFLVGMIARAIRPGCQLDTLPILEGSQGIGKSQGLKALAGDFYADIDSAIGTKEFAEQIQGKWLVELSELSAMRPSEVERVKSGITRTTDVYREPFAILATDHPRQCVFAGTTNQTNYLLDNTGNRRFWPIKCGVIDRQWIISNREQLIAEAAVKFNSGHSWWDVPTDQTLKEQEARMMVDGITEKVQSYIEFHPTNVRISEILEALEVPKHSWSRQLQQRIVEALKALGYSSFKSNGLQVWRNVAGNQQTKIVSIRKA
jgi:hypothetical protein